MNTNLTEYDIKPKYFVNYLRYYGEHFNKNLCEFACKQLNCSQYNKESIEQLYQQYSIQIPNYKLYDIVIVANYIHSKFYGSSINDIQVFLLLINDIFEKDSNLIFNRWYADMAKLGITIE